MQSNNLKVTFEKTHYLCSPVQTEGASCRSCFLSQSAFWTSPLTFSETSANYDRNKVNISSRTSWKESQRCPDCWQLSSSADAFAGFYPRVTYGQWHSGGASNTSGFSRSENKGQLIQIHMTAPMNYLCWKKVSFCVCLSSISFIFASIRKSGQKMGRSGFDLLMILWTRGKKWQEIGIWLNP